MNQPEVVVIGAGAAGLVAARALAEAGRTVIVFEARRRVGGRIFTLAPGEFGIPLEAGAEFIHGRPDATFDLVHQAGLTPYDLPFEHLQRKHGKLERLDDFTETLEPVMAGLAKLKGPDISFDQYLETHGKGKHNADARAMARAFVQGFDAADTDRISAKSLAKELEGLGDVGEELQFKLLEGYGALMHWLARRAVHAGARIRLGAAAHEVRWSKSGVEIRGREHSGRTFTVTARRAIMTLPLGVLALHNEPGAIRFDPDIAGKRRAMSKLGYGPVVKVLIRFNHAFWENPDAAALAKAGEGYKDLSFMNDPPAAMPTWWTLRPLRVPVLVGWAGGPKARELSGRNEREILDTAFESLATLTGHTVDALRRMTVHARAFDWLSDPWSRGAYSYEAVGGSRARAQLAKPLEKTLFFAGEATDTQGQASTVAGAIASGQRAAEEVLNADVHSGQSRRSRRAR